MTKQVAEAFDIESLFQLPYHVVGQTLATRQLIQSVASHLLSLSRPLVLVFTGPSGHGKTEVACRVADLLSVDRMHIDCTEMQTGVDLFGPRPPISGHEDGSQLNNFLDEHNGRRSVVILNEFDKTTDSVRKAMLSVLSTGRYRNRVSSKLLDCSETIWIMATNYGEEAIKRFWDENLVDNPEEWQFPAPSRVLQTELRRSLIEAFGSPFTGCVFSLIPFLPFTTDEKAVLAYTFMRKLRTETRGPIDVRSRHSVDHADLQFLNDGQIAKHIVKLGYAPESGARSLENEVISQVTDKLMGAKLTGVVPGVQVDETMLVRYDVRIVDGVDGEQELEIEKAGMTRLQLREQDS